MALKIGAINPFDVIDQRLQNIEGLLIDIKHNPRPSAIRPEPEKLLTVKAAAKFLDLTVATIYTLISRKQLPVIKLSNRRYFSQQELLDYMKAGRKKPDEKINEVADELHSTGKKKAAKLPASKQKVA